jgi:hypothetical protein
LFRTLWCNACCNLLHVVRPGHGGCCTGLGRWLNLRHKGDRVRLGSVGQTQFREIAPLTAVRFEMKRSGRRTFESGRSEPISLGLRSYKFLECCSQNLRTQLVQHCVACCWFLTQERFAAGVPLHTPPRWISCPTHQPQPPLNRPCRLGSSQAIGLRGSAARGCVCE